MLAMDWPYFLWFERLRVVMYINRAAITDVRLLHKFKEFLG